MHTKVINKKAKPADDITIWLTIYKEDRKVPCGKRRIRLLNSI